MIFSIIIICVLGRDFGCMLKAERASKPGPAQTTPNETARETGPTNPCPSINHHNDTDGSNDDDELESSVDKCERGEGYCCHSSSSRRRRGRGRGRVTGGGEENEAAVTGSTEMRRCGSEARDEDLDESVFTGQYTCVTVCM